MNDTKKIEYFMIIGFSGFLPVILRMPILGATGLLLSAAGVSCTIFYILKWAVRNFKTLDVKWFLSLLCIIGSWIAMAVLSYYITGNKMRLSDGLIVDLMKHNPII